MPIEILTSGNLFDSGAAALVNCVNTVGTMGKGLALEFKHRYPAMFKEYVKLCKQGYIKTGQVWFWHEHDQPCGIEPCRFVINFPTKDHWANPSQLSWISDGLDDLRNHGTLDLVGSIAFPALGCGLGGLNFDDVRALVEEKLGDLDKRILLFTPR